jgi:hypothetical protein
VLRLQSGVTTTLRIFSDWELTKSPGVHISGNLRMGQVLVQYQML